MTLHSWWMTNDFKGHSFDAGLPKGIDSQTALSMMKEESRRLWHMLNRGEIKDYQVELRK